MEKIKNLNFDLKLGTQYALVSNLDHKLYKFYDGSYTEKDLILRDKSSIKYTHFFKVNEKDKNSFLELETDFDLNFKENIIVDYDKYYSKCYLLQNLNKYGKPSTVFGLVSGNTRLEWSEELFSSDTTLLPFSNLSENQITYIMKWFCEPLLNPTFKDKLSSDLHTYIKVLAE